VILTESIYRIFSDLSSILSLSPSDVVRAYNIQHIPSQYMFWRIDIRYIMAALISNAFSDAFFLNFFFFVYSVSATTKVTAPCFVARFDHLV